jgi:UDP-2-acetamido-3-amino-2,3-dideoxy-glucuronate N-acetyltransferase
MDFLEKPFLHQSAIVESTKIGRGTRIWAMAHILPGAVIGEDCNICDHTFVENDVTIGSRVTIKCGVQLWDGITVEDDVFIGPNATFTNDPFPRSKQYPTKFSKTLIQAGASVGANATILPGITIGQRSMVGAGAVVTRDVPPLAIVAGNPGRIIGYSGTEMKPAVKSAVHENVGVRSTRVGGVALHRLPFAEDMRGKLSFGEAQRNVPFPVKRFFIVHGVPSKEVRGEHAHYQCHQFLICTHGSCSVMADDGVHRDEFLLNDPTIGVYLPPRVWAVQYKYSADAVLLVLASEYYDADDYIRNYSDFLKVIGQEGSSDLAQRL